MEKRAFLKNITLAGLGLPLYGNALADWITRFDRQPSGVLASDETFWAGIRGGYLLKPD